MSNHNRQRLHAARGRQLFVAMGAALTALALTGASAGPASASPTAPTALIAEAQCDPAIPSATLRDQILAQPGVAGVDFLNAALGTPTVAQLKLYDVVVATGDCGWSDRVLMGNNLADYQDQGGVVVETNFNWQGMSSATLAGRWITSAYSPYQVGATPIDGFATLGVHDTSSPLLAGVTSLSAYWRNALTLTGGAIEVAKWSDGTSAVAVKGVAVGINANLGDYSKPPPTTWTGDFAKIIVNAAPLPSNSFTARVRGKGVIVNVTAPGKVDVSDAAARLSALATKKKRKLLLKPSSATGNTPKISVPLRLTKPAKRKLRATGKVKVTARITFTPQRGKANTETAKLKIKGGKK